MARTLNEYHLGLRRGYLTIEGQGVVLVALA
jgi:hypothetical protein